MNQLGKKLVYIKHIIRSLKQVVGVYVMTPTKNSSFEVVSFAIKAANKMAFIASDCSFRETCQKYEGKKIPSFFKMSQHITYTQHQFCNNTKILLELTLGYEYLTWKRVVMPDYAWQLTFEKAYELAVASESADRNAVN